MDENYCTAHIRPGQEIVDRWGANLRRRLIWHEELADATGYYDEQAIHAMFYMKDYYARNREIYIDRARKRYERLKAENG